jgi:HK97 family phage major capsid protein
MTVEAIVKSLDKIESNIGNIKITQTEFADRLLQIEQRSTARKEGISTGSGESFGAMVQKKFRENEDSFRKHKVLSLDVELKSINSLATGARSSLAPTPGPDVQVETQLLPKLRMMPGGGVAGLTYSRRSTVTLGAGATTVGENVARTQSEPIYTSIVQTLVTVAAYAELSETALRTTNELQSVVDLHLTRDVFRAADIMLLSGGTNFPGGMLALASLDVLPFAGTNNLLEEFIAIAAMTMRANGFRPDIVVVNPLDWRAVYLRRETNGAYVHASPLTQTPLLISGMRVCFNSAITTGTALVMDSRYVDFMPNDQIRIELAYTGTQFLTGEITVRAEMQGLPVVRDLGAINLVSRAAS